MKQIPAGVDPAIRNPKFWGCRAAKRPREEGFHINECELIECDVPDWWNAEDVQNPPSKHIREWYDPNGTRVSGFNFDGYAEYDDFDLFVAFNDPFGERFIEPPPQPVYEEDSDEESSEPVEQTDAEIKAAHNKVETAVITIKEVRKNTRIYKEAQALLDLFSKNGGILSTKIGANTIKLESEADVDPSLDYFAVPGPGSIVMALAKAIVFFSAPTTAAPTKLSVLKSRVDDYQSKLRSLQIQHRITPADTEELAARYALSEKLLSDKINELKTEIAERMSNTPKTSSGVRPEVVTCRRLLKMVCKQNGDADKFMEALRDICKTDTETIHEEIKHTDAVFHIRASKISKEDADKMKQKKVALAPVLVTPVPATPAPAPAPAPPVAPVARPQRTPAPAPAKKGPSRSDKLAALRAKK